MAYNGNFISFETLLEAVYRRVGFQKLDLNDTIEVVGETMRRIGVLPAFADVTTNGLNDNPIPLEIIDYRAQLPSSMVTLIAARKVSLVDDVDEDDNPIKRISGFYPMVESTNLFYQSEPEHWLTQTVTPGTYDAVISPEDLSPVIVEAPETRIVNNYQYEFKTSGGFIYTNFQTGFVELTYKGFVLDKSGYPMIPDDERYIEALKWAIIETVDYKAWRLGNIPDKVYEHTQQKKHFWAAAAISKANVPSIAGMESLKNMLLRSITKVNQYDTYFKYANIQEQRY